MGRSEAGAVGVKGSAQRRQILVVSRNLPPLAGGMERLMQQLVSGLAAVQTVDLIGPNGFSGKGIRNQWQHPFWFPLFLAGSLLSTRHLAQGSHDIVIGGSLLMAPPALLAARRAGCRVVLLAHGSDVTHASPIYRAGILPLARQADLVIANSRYIAEQLVARGFRSDRIGILPPAIDLSSCPKRTGHLLRGRLGLDKEPLLLGVGRLIPSKGFGEFISDIFPRVLEQIPDAHFALIGDEPAGRRSGYQQEIQSLAQRSGCAGRVHCLGHMEMDGEPLQDAYAAADAHVFPALVPQGFGMVALEAAAQGAPTVAFAQGGVRDAIRPGVTGELIEPGACGEFADAVVALLRHPPNRAGIRAAVSGHDWGDYVEQLLAMLEPLSRPR